MGRIRSIKSSGNVFADLGLPNPDQQMVKAEVVRTIIKQIERAALSQAQVSKLLGLAQPDVSKLLRGNFSGYSFERLFGYAAALGLRVAVKVSRPSRNR